MDICLPEFILDRGRSGIASYIIQLIAHLQHVDTTNRYEVLLSRAEASLMELRADNFNKVSYPNIFENPLLNILWYNSILPIRALKKRYDIIHMPCLRRVGVWKPAKIVATAHDLAAFVVAHKYSRAHMWYHHQVLTRTIHRCDHIIAVSENTKRDVVKWTNYPEDKISVIYPGINRQIFKPMQKDKATEELSKHPELTGPFIVYVSRIEHPGKNHIRLMQAFEQFKRRHPSNYQLVFAGADWTGAEVVKEYAENSPVASSILFLGYIPTQTLVALYSNAQLMAFPSLYEGFGFPLIEAMACGASVICSRSSSLEEIGRGNALMFDPFSIEEIYQCIVKGVEQRDPQLQMDKNRQHLEAFDWNKCASQVVRVYEKLA